MRFVWLHRYRLWLFTRSDEGTRQWIPELGACETVEERADVWQTCYWRYIRQSWGRRVLLLFFAGIVLNLLMRVALAPIRAYVVTRLPFLAYDIIVASVGGSFIGLGVLFLIHRGLQLETRKELNARGYRLCMACGYDLRGKTSSVCTECGAEIADQLPISNIATEISKPEEDR